MTDPIAAYQRLLEIRDERKAQTSAPEVDAVIERLRGRVINELRRGIDELGRIDCEGQPGLTLLVNAQVEWLAAVVAFMGAPQ